MYLKRKGILIPQEVGCFIKQTGEVKLFCILVSSFCVAVLAALFNTILSLLLIKKKKKYPDFHNML